MSDDEYSRRHSYLPATCQHCLADCNHTPLGPSELPCCPVCGAAYSGPSRSREYQALISAGLVSHKEENV